MKKIYILSRVCYWDTIKINSMEYSLFKEGMEIEGCMGFAPIYDSLENLKKVFPEEDYLTMELCEPEKSKTS
jgi:hypothetical protein